MMMVWASPFLPLTCRKPSAPAPPDLLTTMSGRGRELVLLGDAGDEAGHLVGAAARAGRDDELDRLGRLPGGGAARRRTTTSSTTRAEHGRLSWVIDGSSCPRLGVESGMH